MPPATISVYSPNSSNWRWYEPETASQVRWLFHTEEPKTLSERVSKRPIVARIGSSLRCVEEAKRQRSDLIISHSASTTFWTSLAMGMQASDIPLISYSCHFAFLPTGLRFWRMKQAFLRVQRFVVHSQLEKQKYSAHFGIPIDKFDVVRWGVQTPKPILDSPHITGSYICALGKDGRDYGPLVRAMEKLPDLKLVIVARPHNLVGIDVPDNVEVLYNIPLELAMNILHYSQFMALPLKAADVPCGHITLVWAMLGRKALVVTESAGVADYIPDGYEAPQVGAGDVDGWVNALRLMADDPSRRDRCEELGYHFARNNCSHEAALKGCCDVLRKEGVSIDLDTALTM